MDINSLNNQLSKIKFQFSLSNQSHDKKWGYKNRIKQCKIFLGIIKELEFLESITHVKFEIRFAEKWNNLKIFTHNNTFIIRVGIQHYTDFLCDDITDVENDEPGTRKFQLKYDDSLETVRLFINHIITDDEKEIKQLSRPILYKAKKSIKNIKKLMKKRKNIFGIIL